MLAALAAAFIWDDESYEALLQPDRVARNLGALTMFPLALGTRSGVHLSPENSPAAASLLEESDALAMATHGHINQYVPLPLAAFRGEEDEVKRLFQSSTTDFVDNGEGMGLTMAQWATAVLSNGSTRYEDALDAAEQAAEYPYERWFSNWVAVELIEAGSRTGEIERAADALGRLSRTARAGASDRGLGVEARSRALLSHGESAERLYAEAIERLGRTPFA